MINIILFFKDLFFEDFSSLVTHPHTYPLLDIQCPYRRLDEYLPEQQQIPELACTHLPSPVDSTPLIVCNHRHLVTDRKDGKPKTTVCFDENPEDEDFFKTIPLDSQGVFYLFYPYLRHPLLFAPTFGVLYDFDDLMVSDTSSTHVFDQTHFSFPELGTSTNRARVSASVGDTFSTILDKAIRDKESMD